MYYQIKFLFSVRMRQNAEQKIFFNVVIYSVNNFFIFHFSQWTCYCLKPWMDWFDFRISEKNIFKSVIQYHTTGTRDLLNNLTLSRRRPLSYRNQSIDLLHKSMNWFLYDNDLHHERVKSLFGHAWVCLTPLIYSCIITL